MIPKIIHYCWFGGAEKPMLIKHCIESWRKQLPDYEIKEWNETNFDVNMAPLCREAYSAKKWAFVADYCRIFALVTEGGIYMDADVIVLRPLDKFLNYSYCSCQEYQPNVFSTESPKVDKDGYRFPNIDQLVEGIGIQSGVMMAEKGCQYLQDCLEFYNQLHLPEQLSDIIVCRILSRHLEKYGYRYILSPQHLKTNILIEAPSVFANMTALDKNSYAWHLYYRSWGNGFDIKQRIRNRFTRLYLFAQLILHRKFSTKLISRAILF